MGGERGVIWGWQEEVVGWHGGMVCYDATINYCNIVGKIMPIIIIFIFLN